jgi:hypothetical protein
MRLLLIYVLCILPYLCAAQDNWCDVDRRFNFSEQNQAYQQFLERIHERETNGQIEYRTNKYFPVVIHVVAIEPYQPVSLAQALNQLDVLNDDFAGRGQNIDKLLSTFSSLVADAGMHFCLATLDPDGQPTSGITFTHTDVKYIATQTGPGGRKAIHYDQLGGKSGWDPSRYINIWVGEYGDVLGSASFPGMAQYPEEIGLIMNIEHFGSIGDAGQSGYFGKGHTLTHEMGHFFGLRHIWGSGVEYRCDDSDDIDDTPNASGPYYGCPSGEHTSCDASNMYQNFMDFTDDRCLAAFTHDQVIRMKAAEAEYYPWLAVEGSCTSVAASFTRWFDALQWAYDASSGKYIIYGIDEWLGRKEIDVFSTDGKLVLSDVWDDQLSYLLDLNGVSAGVYIVKISDKEKSNTRKIVVY